MGMFSRPVDKGVYIHWGGQGAYESGKSMAAYNAAFRLQQMGGIIMFMHGYDFYWRKSVSEWLRVCIGLDKDVEMDEFNQFLPEDKRKLIILDHADMVLAKYGARGLYDSLEELNMPTLVLLSSWEHAVDLQKLGAKIIGQPGFSRWTKLHENLPNSTCKLDEGGMSWPLGE